MRIAEVLKRYLSTERKTALSWPDWITKRYRVKPSILDDMTG